MGPVSVVSRMIIFFLSYHTVIIADDNRFLCIFPRSVPLFAAKTRRRRCPYPRARHPSLGAYVRVELDDARQQRTPSFIEPVLKKPLRLPLNPYPRRARHHI